MNTNTLEIFSGEIRRETARQGGSRSKHLKGDVLRSSGEIRSTSRQDEGLLQEKVRRSVGLYCFANMEHETRGRSLSRHAQTENEHGVADHRDATSVGTAWKAKMESMHS